MISNKSIYKYTLYNICTYKKMFNNIQVELLWLFTCWWRWDLLLAAACTREGGRI
jgi:hypothetical protein